MSMVVYDHIGEKIVGNWNGLPIVTRVKSCTLKGIVMRDAKKSFMVTPEMEAIDRLG